MRLTFIGADHEVTGSCHVLEVNGKYVLLDCGMEQGRDLYVNQPLPCPVPQIDAVLLSHAHMDHAGLLPWLTKNGFRGQIFTTSATTDLCEIMLRDSAHIQESESEWKSRKAVRAGREEVEPLYTVQDAEDTMRLFVPIEYGETVNVVPGLTARFEDVGHLLGSASIHLHITEGDVTKTLVFSGDIGNTNMPIIRDPGSLEDADYIIMESTYGDRMHGEVPDFTQPLVKILNDTFEKRGTVVVPCFAVGRTQQMLYYLREIINNKLVNFNFTVYVDSPLAVEATKIFENNVFGYYDEEAMQLINEGVNPLRFPGLKLSVTSDESRNINFDMSPKVILSASGMCDAGRIRHHLKHNLWKHNSTIVFCGYQAEDTLGRKLLDGAEEVTLFGEKIEVNAKIVKLEGVSGHADQAGLIRWVTSMADKPDQVFVVHGEDQVTDIFADILKNQYNINASAPFSGAVYDLAAAQWVQEGVQIKVEHVESEYEHEGSGISPQTMRKNSIFAQLLAAGQRLLVVIKQNQGGANKDLKKFTNQILALCERWERHDSD